MSFIEVYEQQLVEAAHRRRDARLRHRIGRWLAAVRGHRRGAAAVLAALVVAVPATTATVGWNPFDDAGRNPRVPPPSVTRGAPDPALAAQLGVLRRPQTPADRGAITTERLRDLSGVAYRGAQVDGIRLLDRERGTVLVPFEQMPVPRDDRGRPMPGFERLASSPAVCVIDRTDDGFGAGACHTADKIGRGLAIGSDGGVVSGLVPDGVARVRLIRGDDTAEAPVNSNLFTAPGAPSAPRFVEWLADDGSLVERIDLNAERAGDPPPAPPSP